MVLAAPEIQNCSSQDDLPSATLFAHWAQCVEQLADVSEIDRGRALVVRLVDREEMAKLNLAFRGKDYPTNVLAFPFEMDAGAAHIPLGDIVICVPVVVEEAQAQGKPFIDRIVHMFVHGVLHLLGYDHQSSSQAETMEALEREALVRLGYAKPYE